MCVRVSVIILLIVFGMLLTTMVLLMLYPTMVSTAAINELLISTRKMQTNAIIINTSCNKQISAETPKWNSKRMEI